MPRETVLLVPSAGDPHGLLAAGRAGARAPGMYMSARGWWPCRSGGGPKPQALVLALDGEPVPEGMDRAARALAAKVGATAPAWYQDNGAWVLRVFHEPQLVRGAWRESTSIRFRDTADIRDTIAVPGISAVTDPAHTLATIAASRLNARVIVLGGSDAER